MENFFELFDERFTKSGTDKNAETILKSLCSQITERWISDKIVATLLTTSGDQQNYITYAVHLSIPDANKYYSYRYIEVKQPIDSYFPVKISAFQHPPSPAKEIKDANELNKELILIVGDIRTRIVQDHLQQVANFDKD